MPRSKRMDMAGVAQHVVQRGNDRQPCFFREIDYVRYLQDLRDAALKFHCDVHAYALMTNHVHLLVTAKETGSVGRMMQAVGRHYVPFVNTARSRTGTLWEGRYKSSLVDSDHYLLACCRYIELNPVRAALVDDVADYRWSSYGHNGHGLFDPLITPHPGYLQLHADADIRRARYRAMIAVGIDDEELATIRAYARRQRAFGSPAFQRNVEAQLGRRAGLAKPGRPKKQGSESIKSESSRSTSKPGETPPNR